MKIEHLKINHLVNPLGNQLDNPTISYVVSETEAFTQSSARVILAVDIDFSEIIYDSGVREDISSVAFELPVKLLPRTRYYWKVAVTADNGDCAESQTAWFETPKDDVWIADWITPDTDKEQQVCICKSVSINKKVSKARMYVVGLGLYELYLNGEKQGNECLLPGFCAYDSWIPFQTFEMSLQDGENQIEIMLGDGWYKGWFGLRKKQENYGDRLSCIGELHIWYEDGSEEIIATDNTWSAKASPVVYSGIYPGEVYDPAVKNEEKFAVKVIDLEKKKLQARRNPRIMIHERIKPVEVIMSPAGEIILDMGQNMVGWLEFHCNAPAGTRLDFQFGEILQDGNFYRDNLRTAKAEFTYISDGVERDVRQHFTFYGFQYVKVMGWNGVPDPEDFTGLVIYSEIEETGYLETADSLVNKLFENAKWGQKGNFLDVPTDCPQRDERYGWTGDAQVFSGTACFNTDAYAFYAKYGYDIFCEQKKNAGAVPDTVPVANYRSTVSTAWGDAATIIPWNLYLHFGDKGILMQQYDSMKAWVDYMKKEDDAHGAKRLWQTGFHYGDWLALDGKIQGGVYGATDPHFIASAYYYYSTRILEKTANILNKEEDCLYYRKLASQIYVAFVREYYSASGKLCVDTMTAYVLVLYMGLAPDYAMESLKKGLLNRLKKSRYHLETGFVGTPYLCRVLSEFGMNDLAYHLLLEKGYPGWLYQVLMGATTIWERWNSVLPDGKISGTAMNSLNHYAYGSIVEWMYRDMLGIRPAEEGAGFKKIIISPKPNYRIPWVKGKVRSASGFICSEWSIENGKLLFSVTIPFDSSAELLLPDCEKDKICCRKEKRGGIVSVSQQGKDTKILLKSGEYSFSYMPTIPYQKSYSIDSPMEELMSNEKTREVLDREFFSVRPVTPFLKELYTLEEIMNGPFTNIALEKQKEIDEQLRRIVENNI